MSYNDNITITFDKNERVIILKFIADTLSFDRNVWMIDDQLIKDSEWGISNIGSDKFVKIKIPNECINVHTFCTAPDKKYYLSNNGTYVESTIDSYIFSFKETEIKEEKEILETVVNETIKPIINNPELPISMSRKELRSESRKLFENEGPTKTPIESLEIIIEKEKKEEQEIYTKDNSPKAQSELIIGQEFLPYKTVLYSKTTTIRIKFNHKILRLDLSSIDVTSLWYEDLIKKDLIKIEIDNDSILLTLDKKIREEDILAVIYFNEHSIFYDTGDGEETSNDGFILIQTLFNCRINYFTFLLVMLESFLDSIDTTSELNAIRELFISNIFDMLLLIDATIQLGTLSISEITVVLNCVMMSSNSPLLLTDPVTQTNSTMNKLLVGINLGDIAIKWAQFKNSDSTNSIKITDWRKCFETLTLSNALGNVGNIRTPGTFTANLNYNSKLLNYQTDLMIDKNS